LAAPGTICASESHENTHAQKFLKAWNHGTIELLHNECSTVTSPIASFKYIVFAINQKYKSMKKSVQL